MPTEVPFRLQLAGGTAEQHEFQAYDGYMALAGMARTLSLAANYAETGKIRQRGDYEGRHAVIGSAIRPGSIIVDLTVFLQNTPSEIFGYGAIATAPFFYDLVRRVIARNLGQPTDDTSAITELISKRSGELETLVAINEAPIRQAHGIVGHGISSMQIVGGSNVLNTFNAETKEYVSGNVEDSRPHEAWFSVASFNANSGYGSVYDQSLGRTVPFKMKREVVRNYRTIFSWGLDQYTNRTGRGINATYWRILALDGTPKQYIMTSAIKDETT